MTKIDPRFAGLSSDPLVLVYRDPMVLLLDFFQELWAQHEECDEKRDASGNLKFYSRPEATHEKDDPNTRTYPHPMACDWAIAMQELVGKVCLRSGRSF